MKKMHLKVLICLSLSLFYLTSWSQQPAEVLPLADQSLVLSITAVGKGGSSLLMVGARGHVLKSEDNGKNWRQIENVPVNIALTKVVSVNDHVWAVGHDATIIHSSDAGETWELQFYDAAREVPFLSAYFVNENSGYVIGAYGTIFSTTDGGKNWSEGLIDEELDYHLNDITRGPNGEFYIAAEAGYFFRSIDHGNTWEAIELPYMGSMFGVVVLDGSVILYGLRGHVLVSDDQGESWLEIEADNPNNLFGAARLSDHSVLLVGANGSRIIYKNKSLNQLTDLDSGDDYADVMIAGKQAILVGETGFKIQAIQQ